MENKMENGMEHEMETGGIWGLHGLGFGGFNHLGFRGLGFRGQGRGVLGLTGPEAKMLQVYRATATLQQVC